MAYAPVPNIVTIHTPKIGCNELSMNALTEILQSDSVKRLLDRSNVYLQTPLADGSVVPVQQKRNGCLSERDSMVAFPELSVIPIMNLSSGDTPALANADDRHLLPSKTEGKSAIALLPLTREKRACGHCEPCESIVCDVDFRRWREEDGGLTPLIAESIEPHEIDAPVYKHCDDQRCDALSIDHDRCRRAVVRCHRCDLVNACDMCLVVLKTRKAKMMHRICKVRAEYRHNRTSRGKLMRDRMRMRELQMLEDTKTKRSNDHTDPTTSHDRAFETLQKNTELIVIPRTSPPIQQHPTIRITSVTGAPINASNSYDAENYAKTTSRCVLPSRRNFFAGNPNESPARRVTQSGKQTNHYLPIRRANDAPNHQKAETSQTLGTQLQTSPFFVPIRVVPISNHRNESTLLHPSQGVPKFCLVSQTPGQSTNTFNKSKILSPQQQHERLKSGTNRATRRVDLNTVDYTMKRFKSGMRRGRRKKNGAKRGSKSFECTFCYKRFSTDWYFKLHIAKHKGEIKFTCKFCKKPFMHHYNMTKHVMTMHKQELTSEDETFVDAENGEFLHCARCKIVFKTKIEHDEHRCPIICLRCNARISDGDLANHLRAKHEMNEERIRDELERQKRQRTAIAQNRAGIGSGKRKREYEREQSRATKIKNGTAKRKRSSLNSNEREVTRDDADTVQTPVRRLTRRRIHCHDEQTADGSSVNGNLDETQVDELAPELRLSTITTGTDPVSR